MDNKQQKLKRTELKSLDKDVNLIKDNGSSIIVGSILATIVAITPILFNLYTSVPDQMVWNTSFFTYTSAYYESLFVLAWTLMNKLIPLLLMFIWIFTCRHWWYHVILVPIGMFVYQIIIIMDDDLSFADKNELYVLLPVMMVIIPSIYLIRARLFNKLNTINKTTQDLEDELTFRPKTFWGKVKQYF